MVVKWPVYSLSTLMFRVQFPVKPTVFHVKFVLEKNENKSKRGRVGLFKINNASLKIFLKYFDRNLQH